MKYFLILLITLLPKLSVAKVLDSSFYQWTVYELQENELEEKKCFMVAHPAESETDNYSRKKPYIMITRYQNRRFEEFSVYSGFEYKIGSKILISIDRTKFNLFSNNDLAWAKSRYDDASIIQVMLDSAQLMLRADAANGTFAVDTYSLKGIAKAYRRMREICK